MGLRAGNKSERSGDPPWRAHGQLHPPPRRAPRAQLVHPEREPVERVPPRLPGVALRSFSETGAETGRLRRQSRCTSGENLHPRPTRNRRRGPWSNDPLRRFDFAHRKQEARLARAKSRAAPSPLRRASRRTSGPRATSSRKATAGRSTSGGPSRPSPTTTGLTAWSAAPSRRPWLA